MLGRVQCSLLLLRCLVRDLSVPAGISLAFLTVPVNVTWGAGDQSWHGLGSSCSIIEVRVAGNRLPRVGAACGPCSNGLLGSVLAVTLLGVGLLGLNVLLRVRCRILTVLGVGGLGLSLRLSLRLRLSLSVSSLVVTGLPVARLTVLPVTLPISSI